jgi:hypothetical protein
VRNRDNFTKHEIETAIRVLMKSRVVTNWVKQEAKRFNIDLNTPEGHAFYERETRAAAERHIK